MIEIFTLEQDFSERKIEFHVSPNEKFGNLKNFISKEHDLPIHDIKIMCNFFPMNDEWNVLHFVKHKQTRRFNVYCTDKQFFKAQKRKLKERLLYKFNELGFDDKASIDTLNEYNFQSEYAINKLISQNNEFPSIYGTNSFQELYDEHKDIIDEFINKYHVSVETACDSFESCGKNLELTEELLSLLSN